MKNTWVLLLCASVTIAAFIACGRSTESSQRSEVVPSGSGGNATTAAFDNYTRPRIVGDRPFKLAVIHTMPEVESQQRSIKQIEIEVAHRGWDSISILWKNDAEARDGILNAINQDVDAIMLLSTEMMTAKQDLIDMARKKGIGIYSNDNQVIPGIICNSTMPNGIAAMELAYKIGEDRFWTNNIAFLTVRAIQVHIERTDPAKSLFNVYAGMNILDEQDAGAANIAPDQFAFDTTKTWLQKYGNEIDGIFCSTDFFCLPISEAVSQAGSSVKQEFWCAGVDGGSNAFDYIRRGTALQYDYAQPFELYTHNVFEVIDQIQIQGLNPGDPACILSHSGATIYAQGIVVTRDNVPNVGVSIHSVFDYYGGDPDDSNAWYNWTDAGGAYVIIGAK